MPGIFVVRKTILSQMGFVMKYHIIDNVNVINILITTIEKTKEEILNRRNSNSRLKWFVM